MSSARSRHDVSIIGVLLFSLIAGVFFRCYHLETKTFWEDEIAGTVHAFGYTEAQIVQAAPRLASAADLHAYFVPPSGPARDLSTTLASLAAEDPQHPPLYYLVNRLWAERAGASIAMLRVPSVCYGLLSIAAMYWTGWELFRSRRTAAVACALLAISPIAVLYSQEAREYSMWTLAVLVSSAALLRACRLGMMRWWMAYAASAATGLYVFPFTAFVILGHGLFLGLTGAFRSAAATRNFGASCLVAALAFSPWLASTNADNGLREMHALLTTNTSPATVVLTLWRDVKLSLIDIGPTDSRLLAFAGSAAGMAISLLVGFAVWYNVRHGDRSRNAFLLWAFVVPFVPFVIHDLLVHGVLVFQARYYMPVYLGVALLLASFFSTLLRVNGRRHQTFAAIALLFVVGAGCISCMRSAAATTWYNKDYERTPQVAALINAMPRPLVVADRGTSRVFGLGWYLDRHVALGVNLHCDSCSVAPSVRRNVIGGRRGYSDIVVLGRGWDEGSYDVGLDAAMRLPGARVSVLGTRIYPRRDTSLSMFAAAF